MKKTMLILITGMAFTFFATHCYPAEEHAIQIHGFVSQGYIQTGENNFVADSKKGTFKFNEAGISAAKRLTGAMHVGIQLFAKDFGDAGNSEIAIDWALIDYRFTDWLGIRMGQLKSPHGFYNEYRDIDTLRTFIFLPQSIYPEITRNVELSIQGGGVYGLIDMNAVGRLSYQALYGTQSIDPYDNRLTEALSGIPTTAVDNDTTEVDDKYVGSLSYETPIPGLRLGMTYNNLDLSLTGHYNRQVAVLAEGSSVEMEFDTYENWVYSLEYVWEDFIFMAEYIDTYREALSKVEMENLQEPHEENIEFEQSGWYVGGSYRFTDWFELGAYYSALESDTGSIVREVYAMPDYYDELRDICTTLRFDINLYWTLKFEYHMFSGAKGLSAFDNRTTEDPLPFIDGDFKKDWDMLTAKLTVAF